MCEGRALRLQTVPRGVCVFAFAGVSFHASWDEMPSCVKDVHRDYKKSLEVCVCVYVCANVSLS